MDRQLELLDKFYNNKATESEKRQLGGLLNDPDRWTDHFDEVWSHSYGNIPGSADDRIFKTICKATKQRQINIRKIILRVANGVAVAAVILVAVFYWYENRLLTKYSDMIVEVAQGQKANIFLPDGTKVHLNADSKLCYGSNFNGKQRQVELIGEAYFVVKKDPQSPFIVKAGGIQVHALGTTFNVQAYPGDETITTYLADGYVHVSSSTQSVNLYPGEAVVYSLKNTLMTKNKEKDERLFTAWINDEMVFDNEPIINIIKLLERNYNVKFEIRDETLKSFTFTGTLKNTSLQSALYALQFTSSISYKKENNVIGLYRD